MNENEMYRRQHVQKFFRMVDEADGPVGYERFVRSAAVSGVLDDPQVRAYAELLKDREAKSQQETIGKTAQNILSRPTTLDQFGKFESDVFNKPLSQQLQASQSVDLNAPTRPSTVQEFNQQMSGAVSPSTSIRDVASNAPYGLATAGFPEDMSAYQSAKMNVEMSKVDVARQKLKTKENDTEFDRWIKTFRAMTERKAVESTTMQNRIENRRLLLDQKNNIRIQLEAVEATLKAGSRMDEMGNEIALTAADKADLKNEFDILKQVYDMALKESENMFDTYPNAGGGPLPGTAAAISPPATRQPSAQSNGKKYKILSVE